MDLRKLEDEGPRLSDKPQKIPDELPDGVPVEKHVALSWLLCVGGWLCCAFMCLWLMVELESWPNAYDMFFWAIILILFCNIFLFLFVSSRAGRTARQLFTQFSGYASGKALCFSFFTCLADLPWARNAFPPGKAISRMTAGLKFVIILRVTESLSRIKASYHVRTGNLSPGQHRKGVASVLS